MPLSLFRRRRPDEPAPAAPTAQRHAVLGTPLEPPFPDGLETAAFAMGCFWGVERLFWSLDGAYTTAAGYAGGHTPSATYREVCRGGTGHAEAVLVVFDPQRLSYEDLLRRFWEGHDPTQGDRQGNDTGSQYRSAILWTTEAQQRAAESSLREYQRALTEAGKGVITTQIAPLDIFHTAEAEHQQYLHRNPHGYCGLDGTGVACALPAAAREPTAGPSLLPLPATEGEWRERLAPDEYRVLRQAGTERPFSGEYVKTSADGTYCCRACGNALFHSTAKFDSRTGWPSFTRTITPEAVELRRDRKLVVARTEVLCGRCHSHLGHVFDDGPDEGGQRWCMNSVALDLHPTVPGG